MGFIDISSMMGYILGILGIFASVFFGLKSIRKKRIYYLKQTSKLIMPRGIITPDLHILFGDKEISDVSVSFYTIWNSGNETIQQTDIVSSKPIIILPSENGEILDAQIIKRSDESCSFNLYIVEGKVQLDFDYADPSDGVLLQIIHTKDLSDLVGKIKGGGIEPFKNMKKKRMLLKMIDWPFKMIRHEKLITLFSIIITLCLFLLAVISALNCFDIIPKDFPIIAMVFDSTYSKKSLGFMAIFFFISCLVYCFMTSLLIQQVFQLGVPERIRFNREEY